LVSVLLGLGEFATYVGIQSSKLFEANKGFNFVIETNDILNQAGWGLQ
jgi:hypothetical protein